MVISSKPQQKSHSNKLFVGRQIPKVCFADLTKHIGLALRENLTELINLEPYALLRGSLIWNIDY